MAAKRAFLAFKSIDKGNSVYLITFEDVVEENGKVYTYNGSVDEILQKVLAMVKKGISQGSIGATFSCDMAEKQCDVYFKPVVDEELRKLMFLLFESE